MRKVIFSTIVLLAAASLAGGITLSPTPSGQASISIDGGVTVSQALLPDGGAWLTLDTNLFILNGETVRPPGDDAGINGIKGLLLQGTTNIAKVSVTAGRSYYIECMLDGGAAHICTYSADAGCWSDPTDINYGRLLPAGQGLYVNLKATGRPLNFIYATGDTATQFTCPVSQMQ